MGGSSNTLDEMIARVGEKDDRPAKRAKVSGEIPWYEKFGSESIRYFMPSEIAKLLGFPAEFTFPIGMTRKKQYALLGNSLHVGTVSRLLHILLSDEP